MTDDDREQLLSDVLDGVATEADVARVQSDAGLTSALAELRRAQQLLRTPPSPVPDTARDAMISAALVELAPGSGAPVIDLASRRGRRHRLVSIVGAAAAALVVISIGVSSLRGSSDIGSDSDSASSAADDELTQSAALAPDQQAPAEAESSLDLAAADPSPADGDTSARADLAEDDILGDDSIGDDSAGEGGTAHEESAPAGPAQLLPAELQGCGAELLAAVPEATGFELVTVDDDRVTVDAVLVDTTVRLTVELATCAVAEGSAVTDPPAGTDGRSDSSP